MAGGVAMIAMLLAAYQDYKDKHAYTQAREYIEPQIDDAARPDGFHTQYHRKRHHSQNETLSQGPAYNARAT